MADGTRGLCCGTRGLCSPFAPETPTPVPAAGTWADSGFPGAGRRRRKGWTRPQERYSRHREARGQRGAAAARLRGTPGISGAPGGGGWAAAGPGRGPAAAQPSGPAAGLPAGSGRELRSRPAAPPSPRDTSGAPGRLDGAPRRSAGKAGGQGAAAAGRGWRAELATRRGAWQATESAASGGGVRAEGRGGKRKRKREKHKVSITEGAGGAQYTQQSPTVPR